MDGKLAVVGLGSVGSMALWRAARRPGTRAGEVVGFEARTPGHGRGAVGGDTRLFRMTYRAGTGFAPLPERANVLWPELEAETGQEILTRCGGLSIGTRDGDYLPQLLATATANGTPFEFLEHEGLERGATRNTGCGPATARSSTREPGSCAPTARCSRRRKPLVRPAPKCWKARPSTRSTRNRTRSSSDPGRAPGGSSG